MQNFTALSDTVFPLFMKSLKEGGMMGADNRPRRCAGWGADISLLSVRGLSSTETVPEGIAQARK